MHPHPITMLCCLYCQLCSIYICSCLFVVPTCMFWTQFKFIFQHDHLIINNSKANGYSRTVPVDCSLSIQIIADRCYWWVWCVAIGTCLCWMNPIPSLSSSPACFAHSHDPNSFSTELCRKQVLVHTLLQPVDCSFDYQNRLCAARGNDHLLPWSCTDTHKGIHLQRLHRYCRVLAWEHALMQERAGKSVRIYMWEGMYR